MKKMTLAQVHAMKNKPLTEKQQQLLRDCCDTWLIPESGPRTRSAEHLESRGLLEGDLREYAVQYMKPGETLHKWKRAYHTTHAGIACLNE